MTTVYWVTGTVGGQTVSRTIYAESKEAAMVRFQEFYPGAEGVTAI